MKRIALFSIVVFVCLSGKCFGQINTFTGQVPCNPNTFWAVNNDTLMEFSLVNGVITPTGNDYVNPFLATLAYANNPFGSPGLSPTFFSPVVQGPVQFLEQCVTAFNGTSWDSVTFIDDIRIINGGGFGDHLYFDGMPDTVTTYTRPTNLYHYFNGILDTIYSCEPSRRINVADQAVDANGNVYFFTGPDSNFTTNNNVDTLLVLSPSGVIIGAYPIAFNNIHAYGSFILHDTLYIGFGPSNAVYPSSLVPVHIGSSSASLGQSLPFGSNFLYFFDLESCNQGYPLGLIDQQHLGHLLNVFPNPAQTDLMINLPPAETSEIRKVILLNVQGQLIHVDYVQPNKNQIQLNLDNLPGGFYFLKVATKSSVYYGRFEHFDY